MRRFQATHSVALEMPAGRGLDAWVAESLAVRLLGLSCLPRIAAGRALLLPRCRSVHTIGMRFPVDVAFVSWPPVLGRCEILAVRSVVPPLRMIAPRGLPRGKVAGLEAAAGALPRLGVRAGAHLWVSGIRCG